MSSPLAASSPARPPVPVSSAPPSQADADGPASCPQDADNVETWSGKDRGQENFPVGVLVRRGLRAHVHAYYAFARNADDIADNPQLTPTDKVRRLDRMEAVLLGRTTHGSPSASRLRDSLRDTGVTPRHATDLLVAFRRDASRTRTATWDELMDYCRFSAMPVGRYMIDLHGETPDAYPASDALCASLQVLNHLQDCGPDLCALDRSYLPQDWLAEAGAEVADVRAPAETPALRRVFDAMLDRCEALNRQAGGLAPRMRDRRFRLECAVIAALARRLAHRLRAADPLAGRVALRRSDAAFGVLSALRVLA